MNKLVTTAIGSLLLFGGNVHADFVINDDLIVDGSACVGFDCVNGESFGFDTIRLKENNLRIKFQDTSVASSFPKNVWQLTANDSANGGAEKFSIDDISGGRTPFTVEAGAPSHSLYVDDGGRLGLGTSTPSVDIHIKDGDTPTLRLEQDGSSGFAPQTWDVAGNETNFFVRDVTNGSQLPFRIRPDAPTNSIFVDTDGAVGVGTSSPSSELDIKRTSGSAILSIDSGTGSGEFPEIRFKRGGTINWTFGDDPAGRFFIFNNGRSVEDFNINDTNGFIGLGVTNPTDQIHHFSGAKLIAGSWTNSSSRNSKQDIHALSSDSAMDALLKLEPVTFSYKVKPEEQFVGFIAEDVPDLIATNDRKGLSSMDVVAVLTKVVQSQQEAITKLEKTISELEKKN